MGALFSVFARAGVVCDSFRGDRGPLETWIRDLALFARRCSTCVFMFVRGIHACSCTDYQSLPEQGLLGRVQTNAGLKEAPQLLYSV